MRKILPVLVLPGLAGCMPNFATVDEACDGKVPGSSNVANVNAVDVFARINCYRRVAKLNRARMDKQVQEAVENHNAYQLENATPEDLDPWNGIFDEQPGLPGYTGNDPIERLEETGYPNATSSTLTYWEWSYKDDQDAVERIDFWFPEPHVRQSYLQLSWVAGGYDEGATEVDPETRIAYVNIFHQVPVRDHAGTPAFFPKDGQEDVPTSFEAVWQATASYGMGQLGYPITATVGATEHAGSANPHNLNVKSAKLTGPEGEVELMIETPDTHGYLRYSVALYPLTPLQPNSEYTYEVVLDWTFNDDRSFTNTFRTGPEFEPHGFGGLSGRGIPQPPKLRHGVINIPNDLL